MDISQEAFDLIVAEEDSDQNYYNKFYRHFDWPGGSSGPTIGIGYDCGYVTHDEAMGDWLNIIADEEIAVVLEAVGLKGAEAHSFVMAHGHEVTVTWEQALKEFGERELPKWCKRVRDAVPNTNYLNPTSFGALVSLCYNRGTGGFSDPRDRFQEMRLIKAAMAAGQFGKVPSEILTMQRLWPAHGDLWKRRAHEAKLFQKGLTMGAAPSNIVAQKFIPT